MLIQNKKVQTLSRTCILDRILKKNFTIILAAAISVTFFAASCTKDIQKSSHTTFLIESALAEAETAEVLTMNDDWQISGNIPWCDITPTEGAAGENLITAKTLSANNELKERVGKFQILCNNVNTEYIVIQRGTPGLNIVKPDITFEHAAAEVIVNVEGNTEFTVASTPEWMTLKEMSSTEGELLEDGITHSLYSATDIKFNIDANETDEDRNGSIILSAAGKTYNIDVKQRKYSDTDFNTPFYRNSLGIRFTATWCGFCPIMGEAYEMAMEQMPDRIIPFNLHPTSSEGGLGWKGANTFQDYYNVVGYPTGVINGIAQVQNGEVSVTAKAITDLAQEAIDSYPAKTNISATSYTTGDGQITINVQVAMKEALNFKISAFVLEDGIVYEQNSGGDDYMHNYVVRTNLTELFGDPVPNIAEASTSEFKITGELPSNVISNDNAYLVLYITYPGEPIVKGVANAHYINCGTIVDNAIKLGLNDTHEFRYEKQ